MQRRKFLTTLAALAGGALVAPSLLASMRHNIGGSMGSNMNNNMMGQNMDHCMGENALSSINNGDSAFILGNRPLTAEQLSIYQNADRALLPRHALPTRQPLPTLTKLTNRNQTVPSLFQATLCAKATPLELIQGKITDFWSYNDQIPGPAIEVFEGDTVEITLQNELSQATTIHWHGLPVPTSEDGNPQDAVKPGEQRTYRFTLPLGSAGTYWYHPHGHNTVSEQVAHGLAGVFIVKAKQDPFADFAQQSWLISDLKLNDSGTIADNSMSDWMNGREGQFQLLNGALEPIISLKEPTRVRLWNACSGKYLQLALPGTALYIIATDGGFIEQPQPMTQVLLSPGERVELLIVPLVTGEHNLLAKAYQRGKMGHHGQEQDLVLAHVDLQSSTMPVLPKQMRTLPKLGSPTQFKSIEYTERMGHGRMLFLINGQQHDMQRSDLTSVVNEVEQWTIFNNSHMDHNFHIHGTQFRVLAHEHNGQRTTPVVDGLKDTINLKPYEKIRLIMQQTEPGIRMYHCHILEHETLGMMGQLEVVKTP